MTNEELCTRINTGEHELVETLIVQNQPYLNLITARYKGLAERNRGMDIEDLRQSAIVGMIEAVNHYDDAKGAFLTIATFYIKKEVRSCLGIRSSKPLIENVKPPVSIYAPKYENNDGESITTILDALESESITDPQEIIAEKLYREDISATVRREVDALPEPKRSIIALKWLYGRPRTYIAQSLGMNYDSVGSHESGAFVHLRKNPRLLRLREKYDAPCYRHKGVAAYKSSGNSAVEDAVLQREKMRECYLSYNTQELMKKCGIMV